MKRLLTLFAALCVLGVSLAPAQEFVATPVTVSTEKVKLNGRVYLSHVVLERQTLYGICKAYGVTEEELYQANPSLREKGLQTNAILLVPYKEAAPAAVEPEVSDLPTHKVRWFEEIDDIAARYGVTVEELMAANGLTSRKLAKGQLLLIPQKQEEEPAAPEALPVPEETILEEQPEEQAATLLAPPEKANFSLVLPLKAEGKTGTMNMDFYSGVLMALKDLEAEGMKAHVNVYDLSEALPPIEELTKSDFVLGPVAPRNLEAILQRVEGRVTLISPLDPRAASLSAGYKSFVQVPSAVDCQYEDLALWVKEELKSDEKVLLITEKGAANVTAAVGIRSALAAQELPYEILSYAIVEGRSIPEKLEPMLAGKDSLTRVVVASESEAFMGDVVRNLGLMLGKGHNLVMYAPSKVRNFETIDGTAFHDASLHVCSTYYVDYSDPRVDRFVHAYRALFRTEPSQFAFQGYDSARYFITLILRYGKDWPSSVREERSRGLHTDFFFQGDENGNLCNKAVRRIIFDKNYTTILLP